MAKAVLPKNILKKERLSSLSPNEKSEYMNNVLKTILELNPNGLTDSQIKEATGYTYSTIWHHLETLAVTEQCYKVQRGNVDVFFPIERIIAVDEIEDGKNKSTYSFNISKDGKFVFVYKKTEDRLGNRMVSSGISIPANLVNDFISVLNKIRKSK